LGYFSDKPMIHLLHIIKLIIPEILIRKYRECRIAIERIIYKGDKVICPICKSKFKLFTPSRADKRKNSKCICCGSLERHRLLWLYLNEKTNIFNGNKIRLLHFAPEKAFYDIFSEIPYIDYFPCDLFPGQYAFNGSVAIEKTDIMDIQFADNYFDVILCNHVLEHIPDDKKAMAELKRVLKKNGWGIFQVPIDEGLEKTFEDISATTPEQRKKKFGQSDHVRIYGRDYKDRLADVGFKVHPDDFVKKFSPVEIKMYGIQPDRLIYFCEG